MSYVPTISGKLYNALEKFTAPDKDFRKALKQLWYDNGAIYATDSYMLIQWNLPKSFRDFVEKECAGQFQIKAKHKPAASAQLDFTTDDFVFTKDGEECRLVDKPYRLIHDSMSKESGGDSIFNADFIGKAAALAKVVKTENGRTRDPLVGDMQFHVISDHASAIQIKGGVLGDFNIAIMPIRG